MELPSSLTVSRTHSQEGIRAQVCGSIAGFARQQQSQTPAGSAAPPAGLLWKDKQSFGCPVPCRDHRSRGPPDTTQALGGEGQRRAPSEKPVPALLRAGGEAPFVKRLLFSDALESARVRRLVGSMAASQTPGEAPGQTRLLLLALDHDLFISSRRHPICPVVAAEGGPAPGAHEEPQSLLFCTGVQAEVLAL